MTWFSPPPNRAPCKREKKAPLFLGIPHVSSNRPLNAEVTFAGLIFSSVYFIFFFNMVFYSFVLFFSIFIFFYVVFARQVMIAARSPYNIVCGKTFANVGWPPGGGSKCYFFLSNC